MLASCCYCNHFPYHHYQLHHFFRTLSALMIYVLSVLGFNHSLDSTGEGILPNYIPSSRSGYPVNWVSWPVPDWLPEINQPRFEYLGNGHAVS